MKSRLLTTPTAGPYEAHRTSYNGRPILPEKNPPAYITAGDRATPGNRIIAAVYHSGGADAEANAVLLAAAPEMLEALETFIRVLDDEENHSDFGDCVAALEPLARAIIAKARGEA